MRDWPEKEFSFEEAKKTYPILWVKIRKMFGHLILEDRIRIFNLVVGICPHCYEDGKSCVCWRDD